MTGKLSSWSRRILRHTKRRTGIRRRPPRVASLAVEPLEDRTLLSYGGLIPGDGPVLRESGDAVGTIERTEWADESSLYYIAVGRDVTGEDDRGTCSFSYTASFPVEIVPGWWGGIGEPVIIRVEAVVGGSCLLVGDDSNSTFRYSAGYNGINLDLPPGEHHGTFWHTHVNLWDLDSFQTTIGSTFSVHFDVHGEADYEAGVGGTFGFTFCFFVWMDPSGNDPPVAVSDRYAVGENSVLTVPAPGVLANDGDRDGDSLTAVLVSPPSHGAVALGADGSFTYTAGDDFDGMDSFTYVANDGQYNSNVATVTIVVEPDNHPPVAVDDQYTIEEDTVLTTWYLSGLIPNDYDYDNDPLSVVYIGGPWNGTIEQFSPDGSFTYRPPEGFHGTDYFTYKISDGKDESGLATVSIVVEPDNDPPVARNDDNYVVIEFGQVDGNVLQNDTDPDGDPLWAVQVSQPTQGDLEFHTDGSFNYSPRPGASGCDSFTYKAYDGEDYSNLATVSISIVPLETEKSP